MTSSGLTSLVGAATDSMACVAVDCREACQVVKPTMQTSHSHWETKWNYLRATFQMNQDLMLGKVLEYQ